MRTGEIDDVGLGGETFDAVEAARLHHVVEFRLKQRVMSAAAFGPQRVDQQLERKVLMRQRGDDRFPDLSEQLRKSRALGDLGTQHQRIDETSDQAFELRVATSGNGNADAQIVLTGISIQKRLIGAEQQHEDTCAMPNGDIPETGGKRSRRSPARSCPRHDFAPPDAAGRAAEPERGASRRAAYANMRVAGRLRRWRASRAARPQNPHTELPEPAERQKSCIDEAAIKPGQFFEQHVERPAIHDDVMGQQQQLVFVVGELKEACAQQWSVDEIERLGKLGPHQRRDLFGPFAGRITPEVLCRIADAMVS